MVSKILACFTRAKLLKISAFLLIAVCEATALPLSGIDPVVRRYSGNTKRSCPPSSRSSATSVYCTRKILARTMHRSIADTPGPNTDPTGNKCSGSEISSIMPGSIFWVIVAQPLSYSGGTSTLSHFTHHSVLPKVTVLFLASLLVSIGRWHERGGLLMVISLGRSCTQR